MKRVRELDGLRAVAILLVIACHFEGFSQLAGKLPEFGWIGVDVFFVLSGYLITNILLGLRGRPSPYKTFYSRRLLRILPPYTVVIIFLFGFALQQHWLTRNVVANQLLFAQAYQKEQRILIVDIASHPRWYATHLPSLLANAHHLTLGQDGVPLRIRVVPAIFWSLSVEEYFYLLWAPIVLRFSLQWIIRLGGLICLIEMLLRWLAHSEASYFGLPYRFDTLLYGAFLAILLNYWRRHTVPVWSKALLFGLSSGAALGLAAISYTIRPVFGYEIRESPLMMVFGLPLFSILAAAIIGMLILHSGESWWLGRLLRSRVLQFVGTVSYTMYLVHLVAASAVRHLFGVKNVHSQTFFQAVLATALTICVAQVSWRFLESPLLQWKDRRFPNSPHPSEPDVSWTASASASPESLI